MKNHHKYDPVSSTGLGFKVAIDDLTHIIEKLRDDVEDLKKWKETTEKEY